MIILLFIVLQSILFLDCFWPQCDHVPYQVKHIKMKYSWIATYTYKVIITLREIKYQIVAVVIVIVNGVVVL